MPKTDFESKASDLLLSKNSSIIYKIIKYDWVTKKIDSNYGFAV